MIGIMDKEKVERQGKKNVKGQPAAKNPKMRRRLVLCGALLVLILAIVGGALLLSQREPVELSGVEIPDAVKLEGSLDRKISKAEYAFFEAFVGRDLLDPSEEELEEKTKQMILEVNAKYAIGSHLGLCEPYTYAKMQSNLARENKDRAQMKESGEVFYGPVSFDEIGYFKFEYSNLDLNIVNEFVNNPDRLEKIRSEREEEIYAYYEENTRRYEHIEEVTYELSIDGGEPEVKTADWGEMRNMYMADDPLGTFLLNNEEGAELDFETTTDTRRAKILSVQINRPTYEDSWFNATRDYVTMIYYPELVEIAVNMSNLKM